MPGLSLPLPNPSLSPFPSFPSPSLKTGIFGAKMVGGEVGMEEKRREKRRNKKRDYTALGGGDPNKGIQLLKDKRRKELESTGWKERMEKYILMIEHSQVSQAINEFSVAALFDFEIAKKIVQKAKEELRHESIDKQRQAGEPGDHWDVFYQANTNQFFKDRLWIGDEFPILDPQYKQSDFAYVWEIGCGVGNTLFPLSTLYPNTTFIGNDFSAKAIEIMKATSTHYDPSKHILFVGDITKEETLLPIAPYRGKVEVVTLFFTLSALDPVHQVRQSLSFIYHSLCKGGYVCIRDYANYDMTELRFVCKRVKPMIVIDENQQEYEVYHRGDCTSTHFIHLPWLQNLAKEVGFDIITSHYVTIKLYNRKRDLHMYRVFVQCTLRKPMDEGTMDVLDKYTTISDRNLLKGKTLLNYEKMCPT